MCLDMRKSMFIFIILLSTCLVLFSACYNSPPSNLDIWIGEYYFLEIVEPLFHEYPKIIMAYDLTIYREADVYLADVSICGWQTMARLNARVVGTDNSIDILFIDYLVGNMTNVYEKGDLLLSLSTEDMQLYTKWGMVNPIDPKHISRDVYFEKIR